MKALLTVLLLTVVVFSAHATEIRIRNDSKVDFTNVVVGGKKYGDIKHGATTGYQTWAKAYRFSSVSLMVDGKPIEIRPRDYVGETPLGDGNFTFILTVTDGSLEIRAEPDQKPN